MPGSDSYGQKVPYPKLSDSPNLESSMSALVDSVTPLTNMVFANANERAASIPAPVDGMESYLIAEQRKDVCVGGVWQEAIRGTLGWTDVGLASGYIPWDGNTIGPRVRRVGPIVYMEGRLMKVGGASISALSLAVVGTVPLAYRPVGHYAEAFVTLSDGASGTSVGRAEIWHTDGSIKVTTEKASTFIGFSAWWFVT